MQLQFVNQNKESAESQQDYAGLLCFNIFNGTDKMKKKTPRNSMDESAEKEKCIFPSFFQGIFFLSQSKYSDSYTIQHNKNTINIFVPVCDF